MVAGVLVLAALGSGGGGGWLTFRASSKDPLEIERAVSIIQRRLHAAGFEDIRLRAEKEELLVEAVASRESRIRNLVERQAARLELRVTVEPDAPNYDVYWRRLEKALDNGVAFEEAREIPVARRAGDDIASGRYPHGLRWYRLGTHGERSYSPRRLPPGGAFFVLCELDDFEITAKSLEHVAYRRSTQGLGGDWVVAFRVRKAHQANMALLTGDVGDHLAIILEDEVFSAPVLRSTLSDSGEISGGFTEDEARDLSVLLASEALPCRFEFVERCATED